MVERDDKYYFFIRQESLYFNSNFLGREWYRKLFGGKWILLKLGRDTPYIGMFCVWTKNIDVWSGDNEVLAIEEYLETGVDTKLKLYKEFFRNLFNK